METYYFTIGDDFGYIDDLFEEMNIWSLIENHESDKRNADWTVFETKPIGWKTYDMILDLLESEDINYLELD